MPESQTTTVAKYQSILFDTEGEIAIVTLNRPQRRNALSLDLMREVIACLDKIGRDGHGVMLAAAGKVFFGHDLSEMVGRDINDYRQVFDVCTDLMTQRAVHSAAGDRRGARRRDRGRMPAGGDLRSGDCGGGGGVRHTRREDRTVLHHADGGAQPRRRPQTRAANAAHRRADRRADGRRLGIGEPGRPPRSWPSRAASWPHASPKPAR